MARLRGRPVSGPKLDGETLAAFRAACINHGTTTAGCHAGTKTVGASTVNNAGLVCSFHAKNSYRKTERTGAYLFEIKPRVKSKI
jgi:hypothetical protein